jgi:hypothetical protein
MRTTSSVSPAGHRIRRSPSLSAWEIGTIPHGGLILVSCIETRWHNGTLCHWAKVHASAGDGWSLVSDGRGTFLEQANREQNQGYMMRTTSSVSPAGHRIRRSPSLSAWEIGTIPHGGLILVSCVETRWHNGNRFRWAKVHASAGDGWSLVSDGRGTFLQRENMEQNQGYMMRTTSSVSPAGHRIRRSPSLSAWEIGTIPHGGLILVSCIETRWHNGTLCHWAKVHASAGDGWSLVSDGRGTFLQREEREQMSENTGV